MRKFSIGSTAACLALAVSACTVAPVSEEENIGTDSEALSTAFTEECGEPVELPPYFPPTEFPPYYPPTGCVDSDYDGVCNIDDLCEYTEIPEDVPLIRLKPNHFALKKGTKINGVFVFDKGRPGGGVEASQFSIEETGGCSCEQILDKLPGNRIGLYRFGCSYGIMSNWVRYVERVSR